ncbi:MAG: hypothetical protein WAL02_12360 [Rhodoplanes sp.]
MANLFALLQAIQASAYAAYVRDSLLIYPAANIAHVVAVMVFFAAVAAMDLRLMRVIRGTPAPLVIARLRPVAIGALVVIAATGAVLFVPEAVSIGRNWAFLLKLVAIALALGNIAANDWALRRTSEKSVMVQMTAGLSLMLWLSVAALGRAIAYV